MKLVIAGEALDAAADALAAAARRMRAAADDRKILGPVLSHGAWRYQVQKLLEGLCTEDEPELAADDEAGA